jgi:hypothetical protein
MHLGTLGGLGFTTKTLVYTKESTNSLLAYTIL